MKIAGEIGLLHDHARSMSDSVDSVRDCGTILGQHVESLVGDVGWNGDAADAFYGKWERDAAAISDLADVVQFVSTHIQTLANDLSAAQTMLNIAVANAQDAGVPVADDGSVPGGTYSAKVVTAIEDYGVARKEALKYAQDARDKATGVLHDVAVILTGDDSEKLTFLNGADAAALGMVLRGLYTLPNSYATLAKENYDELKRDYKEKAAGLADLPEGSEERLALADELADIRFDRLKSSLRLAQVDRFASKFPAGDFLNTNLGDMAHGAEEVEDASKLSRLVDGVPIVDITLGTLASAVQIRDDRQKGWSWTKSVVVDGGSNAAAILTGVSLDEFPPASIVGSYIVGAGLYEAGHEGHWTEHTQEDGLVKGSGEFAVDTAKATWNNDVIGMGHKILNDAHHPKEAAESLWAGVKKLI